MKKEFVVRLVHRENVALQANLVQQVLWAHKEFKVLKVPLELLVLQDQLVKWVRPVIRVNLVLPVHEVHLVHQATVELPEECLTKEKHCSKIY